MKRIGKAFCALFLALLVVVPTCLAANHSHSYTVAGTGGVWNGKEEGVLWVLNKDDAVFTASITSSETRTIGAQLRYIREYFPDSTLATLSVTGKNGTSNSSQPFYPKDTSAGHYAYVICSEGNGAQGNVIVSQ